MEIKPTGPENYQPPAVDAGEVGKTTRLPEAGKSGKVEAAQEQALASVAAQFSKADLQDPAKVEKMLSSCASELLGSALDRVKGPASKDDSRYLADWLRDDPYIRGKLMSYLERVLT